MEILVARSPRARLVGLALRRASRRARRCCCRAAARSTRSACASRSTWSGSTAPAGCWPSTRRPALAGARAAGGAAAVVEVAAGNSGTIRAMAEPQRNRLAVALDPRVPIYRDTYNEYFVLALSAGGAAAGTQVPLYIVMAITGIWSVGIFVAACVVFELVVIFGLARPQMQPQERAGWVVLWGATTAILALAFYYLVAQPTL